MEVTPTPAAGTNTVPPQGPSRREGSGAGCWIVGTLTAFVVFVLVIVGLFLPPISLYERLFGAQYVPLTAAGDSITTTDQSFRLVAAAPSNDFAANLNSVSLRDFVSDDGTSVEWIPEARNAVPFYLALQSPVYTVDARGHVPDALNYSVQIPANAPDRDLIDLYGWRADTQAWEFVPAQAVENHLEATTDTLYEHIAIFQAAPDTPRVVISYDVTQVLSQEAAQLATVIAPAGLQPTTDGNVTGSLAPGFDLNNGYLVMPVIRDFADPRALDTQTANTIMGNRTLRTQHANVIAQIASGGGFDGVFIDYRGLSQDQRENFSAFITDLGQRMDNVGLMLGVVVPAAENVEGVWQTGVYDWRALGQSADFVQIDMGLDPETYTTGQAQLIEAMLRWGVSEVSRYKLLMGLSARSVREFEGTFTTVGYDEALSGLGDVDLEALDRSETGSIEPGSEIRASLDGMPATAGVDTTINTPYIDYLNDDQSQRARLWLTTGDALRYRMDLTVPFALGGIAFEDLLTNDLAQDVYETVADYRTQIPSAPSPTDLALRWSIESSDGLVDEIITNLNEDLVITLEAPDGNYAVNVAVVGIGQEANESVRSGAAVALFQPTATPTPLPTSTPTPMPTVTPTPAPIVATQAAAPSGGGFGAVAPASGSIGSFEIGGHVNNVSGQAIGAMQRSGMVWMKKQIRFYPGYGAESAIEFINQAHAAGFKALVGTVGNPVDLAGGGEAYLREFANWVGAMAAAGADAIEVWNEPNIDREWPEGQISGGNYVVMLRLAYQSIKSANGSTIVISAAPSPTGAEAAFPGRVVNDNNWLRQVVDAGGLNYMDCLGMHYNEGIVPPNATGGDPRGDNYYTRFLTTFLNEHWSIIGGQRPICVTELGYLTPEGYPALSSYWAWGQNTTVAQQAAWLAQAASILSNSGKARMMVVWNVDFTQYASDPQGGYAIIRPDGSCPACDALAAAR